jgi:hypothetical protein
MGNALVVGLVEQMGRTLAESPAVVHGESAGGVGAVGQDD